MTVWLLAWRNFAARPRRTAVLLLGYAIGVAVMIVLLSVGDAMLDQSRDVALVGGGQLSVLPEGVDVEAMRTGGLAGMFFGIDGARFVTRELIGGRRNADVVAAVAPVLEQKLVLLHTRDTIWSVRAGGELPDQSAHAGAGLRVIDGRWTNSAADSQWAAPTAQQLYDELDHFHHPVARDSTWAEWDYFNFVVAPDEWWYVTLLIGGDVEGTRWGGQVLITHRDSRGRYQRSTLNVDRNLVSWSDTAANLVIGHSSVTQRDGLYHLVASTGEADLDVTISPTPHAYFPSVDIGGSTQSGYAVPALRARASGRFCDGLRCRTVSTLSAYHDHNWGTWRDVTWEWGTGSSQTFALLYGGVLVSGASNRVPLFFGLLDSLGVAQVYRFDQVVRSGQQRISHLPQLPVPDSLHFVGRRANDSLAVDIAVTDATASTSRTVAAGRIFLQMRGRWTARGSAAGRIVNDTGTGFFETWLRSSANH